MTRRLSMRNTQPQCAGRLSVVRSNPAALLLSGTRQLHANIDGGPLPSLEARSPFRMQAAGGKWGYIAIIATCGPCVATRQAAAGGCTARKLISQYCEMPFDADQRAQLRACYCCAQRDTASFEIDRGERKKETVLCSMRLHTPRAI